MHNTLEKYVSRYVSLSETELNTFFSELKQIEVNKKDYLLNEGQICENKYFILEGCLRFYQIDEKGNEQIIMFGIENWWVTNYDSFINQTPSKIYIQALEKTTLLALNKESLEKLYKSVPKIERLFRIIIQKAYIASQRRIEIMTQIPAEERYDKFIKDTNSFTQRIPQYMLASYLGFTPEFLSKVRGKKRTQK